VFERRIHLKNVAEIFFDALSYNILVFFSYFVIEGVREGLTTTPLLQMRKRVPTSIHKKTFGCPTT
jgi:hypothetical protein